MWNFSANVIRMRMGKGNLVERHFRKCMCSWQERGGGEVQLVPSCSISHWSTINPKPKYVEEKQTIISGSSNSWHTSKRKRENLEDSSIPNEKAVRDEGRTEMDNKPQFPLQWLPFDLIFLRRGHCYRNGSDYRLKCWRRN